MSGLSKVRIVTPHADLTDTDYHEWGLAPHSDAHRHGGPGWLEARCNNPDCPAVALISKDAVIGLLDEAQP